jgi:hypothetical protein
MEYLAAEGPQRVFAGIRSSVSRDLFVQEIAVCAALDLAEHVPGWSHPPRNQLLSLAFYDFYDDFFFSVRVH